MERRIKTFLNKLTIVILTLPVFVFAKSDGGGGGGPGEIGVEKGLFDDTAGPIDDPNQILTLIKNAMDIVLVIGGIAFFAMLLWGGITLGTAGGNEERVGQGKKILTAAVIGFLIVVLSRVIVGYLIQFFGGTIATS